MFGSLSATVTALACMTTTFSGLASANGHSLKQPQPSNLTELRAQVEDNLRLDVDAQTQFYWRDDDPKEAPGFNQTVHRWSARGGPQLDLVVHVMREVDVAAVVCLPFFAIPSALSRYALKNVADEMLRYVSPITLTARSLLSQAAMALQVISIT